LKFDIDLQVFSLVWEDAVFVLTHIIAVCCGFLVLKFGHYGKQIRITWRVLKYGGDGWKSSVGPSAVRNEKVLQRVKGKGTP
jgi:hypothetical protein